MKRKSLFKRIIIGLVAGVHYVHAIATYNHKKYNTQKWVPKTLECYIAGSLAGISTAVYLYLIIYISWLFVLIPLVTNIVAYLIHKGSKR